MTYYPSRAEPGAPVITFSREPRAIKSKARKRAEKELKKRIKRKGKK